MTHRTGKAREPNAPPGLFCPPSGCLMFIQGNFGSPPDGEDAFAGAIDITDSAQTL